MFLGSRAQPEAIQQSILQPKVFAVVNFEIKIIIILMPLKRAVISVLSHDHFNIEILSLVSPYLNFPLIFTVLVQASCFKPSFFLRLR